MLAILQMADTPQIESSAYMLQLAGYTVKYCGAQLRDELRRAGCETVLAPESMYAIGYDRIEGIDPATPSDMNHCDLFCEIKVNNLSRIVTRWPHLNTKLCWWRVNGGMPEITPHGGDETDCQWPVVGANLWYREPEFNKRGRNYVFYPPYPRMQDYLTVHRAGHWETLPPFCLCHGVSGWGYNAIVGRIRESTGTKVFGQGSPDGVIPHREVYRWVRDGLCMVHLKGSDCPGWALYEAMLAGCPVVMPRLLPKRSHMEDLFIDGQTYLGVGPELAGHGKGDPQHDVCLAEIQTSVELLKDMTYNQKIGQAGRNRLLNLMWRADRDLPAFQAWLSKEFK